MLIMNALPRTTLGRNFLASHDHMYINIHKYDVLLLICFIENFLILNKSIYNKIDIYDKAIYGE